jgi:hypothetical protein
VTDADEKDDFDTGTFRRFNVPPFLQRTWKLIALVLLVLCLSPLFSRLVEHYRGVVLAVHNDEMLLGRKDHFPVWVTDISVEPGAIIVKELGQWRAKSAEPVESDQPLLDLFRRYTRRYVGPIVEMRAPVVRTGPWTAVVKTTDGQTIDVPLWSEALSSARVGLWLRKDAESWDPVLIDPPAATP